PHHNFLHFHFLYILTIPILAKQITQLMISKETIEKILQFRNDRDWEQFHNSKDLSLALSVEASELLELFLWKGNEDVSPERLKEELADVLMYAILLAEKHQLNMDEVIQEKLSKNNQKYPVQKARGNATKYDKL